MKTPRIGLLSGLLVATLQPVLFGQPPAKVASTCGVEHQVIAPRNPVRASNGIILPAQSLTQARIVLGGNATILVVEHPHAGKDLDAYNSTIIVQESSKQQNLALEDLVERGRFFRIVETAKLCSSPDAGTAFLAFEVPYTGTSESFAAVQYSPQGISVRALPGADQGRIVVNGPTEVEVWSARAGLGPGVIESNAAPKRYAVRVCRLGQEGVRCSDSTRVVGFLSPGMFIGARIEVR